MFAVADAFHVRSMRVAETAVALRFVGGVTATPGPRNFAIPCCAVPWTVVNAPPASIWPALPAMARTVPSAPGFQALSVAVEVLSASRRALDVGVEHAGGLSMSVSSGQ